MGGEDAGELLEEAEQGVRCSLLFFSVRSNAFLERFPFLFQGFQRFGRATINNRLTSSSSKRADSHAACEPVYKPHPGPRSIVALAFCFVMWRASLDGPNRQSPIASVQRTRSTLASHSRNSMWNEYYTNERQSRDSNRNATNAGSTRTNFCVFRGRYDRQRTLVIRIAAITLASDSAITIVRFRPSKRASLMTRNPEKSKYRKSDSKVTFWVGPKMT